MTSTPTPGPAPWIDRLDQESAAAVETLRQAMRRDPRHLTGDTQDQYARYATEWCGYLERRGTRVIAATPADVERWVTLGGVREIPRPEAPRVRRPSRSVTAKRLSALRALYRALEVRPSPVDPIARPRPTRGEGLAVRLLTPLEIADLMAAARDRGPTVYAALRVMADLGARGVEIRRLRVRDWRPNADGGPTLRLVGRGGHVTLRRLPVATAEAVAEAVAWARAVAPGLAGPGGSGPLLPTPRGGAHGPPAPLDADRMRRLWHRIVFHAGLDADDDAPTPHALRHGWVRHAVASGWPITAVQAEIGHAALSSTLRYLQGGVGQIHPLAGEVRAMSTSPTDGVLILRAISGGETWPLTAEVRARRREIEARRPDLEIVRELAAAREEAARLRAEVAELRAAG